MTSRNVEPKAKQPMENPVANDPKLKPVVELDRNTSVNQKDMGQDNSTAECKFNRHKGSIYETCNFLIDGRESDSTREGTNILETNNNKEPNLELSLKRHRGAPDTERSSQEERFVLRRSEQSAFSRSGRRVASIYFFSNSFIFLQTAYIIIVHKQQLICLPHPAGIIHHQTYLSLLMETQDAAL